MGLSSHVNQLKRRMKQYPNHFIAGKDASNGERWFITKEYAAFIVINEMLNQTNSNLKGGSHE